MASVQFDINTDDIESRMPTFSRQIQSLPALFVQDAVLILQDQMQQEVPVSSGRLQSSITGESDGETGVVQTNSGYGAAVDRGRRGLDIYPKNAKFLRFFYNGKIVYARHAHPGPAKANNFVKRTLMNAEARINDAISERTKSVLSTS